MKQTLEFNRVSINGAGTVRARWVAGFQLNAGQWRMPHGAAAGDHSCA